MKRNHVVVALLCLLVLSVFLGCDNATPAADERFEVTSYKAVTLADLKPFASGVGSEVPEFSRDNQDFEQELFYSGMDMLGFVLSEIITGNSNTRNRSLAAGFQLHVKNENVRLEDEESDIFSEIDIQHLDIVLDGKINSLSNLLMLIHGDGDLMTSAILADGRVQISEKIRTTSNDFFPDQDFTTIQSLLLDLKISGSLPTSDTGEEPTGLLSGKLQFSIGSNVILEWISGTGYKYYTYPLIFKIDVKPFKDVDLAALTTLNENIDEDSDLWALLKEVLWPGSTATDLLTITRIVGSYDATGVLETETWKNEEAFSLLPSLVLPIS